MRKHVLLFLLLISVVFAQERPQLPGELQPFTDALDALISTLNSIGVLPQNLEFGTQGFNTFMVLFLMFWMVLDTFIELNPVFSFVFSLMFTSYLLNNFPSMFDVSSAQASFQVVFSGLFLYLLLDFVLQFVWALSSTTKLMLKLSIVLIAVFTLNFTGIYDAMANWVQTMVGTVGFTGFIIFLIASRMLYMFFAVMNLGPALQLRDLAGSRVREHARGVGKESEAYMKRRGTK